MRILLPWAFYFTNLTFSNSCIIYQLSETILFTDVAPFLIEEKLCFLFYKQVDVRRSEVYRAISSILNNNISNFYDKHQVDFKRFEAIGCQADE